ncbi:O-antigen ligase RfaL [Siccibacter colletis]|uniref:O-antigen ligase RfaL n=1 Tax=Siccibacter colletis TaxID=1505757 RepID=UPI0028BEAF9E|nr:O-antigen ligase RfaL [Siccibacter colletis]WNN48368.1 O-antigen ligase RfaL [Siccibacter colletis]
MVLDQLSQQREQNWQSLWNRGLVSLYIILYFLDGVTRYKHIVSALLYITAITYIVKHRGAIITLFKNNLTTALLVFLAAIIYSIIISIDPGYSVDKAANSVFEKLVVIALIIPIVLFNESKEDVARTFIYALIIAIIPLAIADFIQYIDEYHRGIMPFTYFEHKYKSDALIFMSPALLYLWTLKGYRNKLIFFALAIITALMIIGTMQRGTWLAILVMSVVWAIVKREWKLPALALAAVALFFTASHHYDPGHFAKLFNKMQQTSSSGRYGNGTQGSAVDLIMENPVKGYGFGDDIFYRVYNERIKDYPQWIFKKAIGPHNLTLATWYAAGIFGLVALWYLLISLGREAVRGYQRSDEVIRNAWLTLGLILLGNLIVRGAFETVNISNLGVLLGIALALRAKQKQV